MCDIKLDEVFFDSGGAALTDQVIVVGRAGEWIEVHGHQVYTDTQLTATFESDAATDVAVAKGYPPARGGWIAAPTHHRYFRARLGESLLLTTSVASNVSGNVQYRYVKKLV